MAQSVKIPVELEIQSLQGEVSRMRKMLGELKPNTKAFQELEKRIDKVNHSLISLENRSKQTFSNQSEITNFSKSFDKIGLAIQDIYTEFQRLDFKDLQLSSSDPSVQQIENLKKSISGLEQQIKEIDKEILSDDNIISPDTIQTVKTLDASFDVMKSTIKDALGLLETELNNTNKEINAAVKNSQKLEDAYEKAAEAEDKAKANRDKTKQREAFGRNDLLRANKAKKENNFEQARNLALQYHMSTQDLNRVNESALNKLSDEKRIQTINEFYDKVITLVETKVQKLKDATVEAEDSVSKAVAETTSAFDKYADEGEKLSNLKIQKDTYESAKLNLEAGQQEGANRVQNYNNQIQNLIHSIAQLVQQLQQSNIVTKEAGKGQQETADTIKIAGDKIEESTDQINHLTEAEEKLGNIKNAIKNWFGFNEVINMSKNAVRNAITHIRELDKTMTEIAIVTDMTQQELWGQIDTYSALAQQYGATTKGVYEVSQLYYQQGLQTSEVMDLTSETLKMARISSLSYADATDYMTVALRGFKLEMSDAQNIVDVYSNIAAVSASDTEELAVAMSKTASSAEAVGASFENTTAMIALMVETTREAPENIGSAMKSIISRYGEMTSDPMKLVDSEGEEMSLNKVDKALQSVGISLQDAQGQFRNFDDVILELAESWDTIDKNTQRYIATVMAGNRQQSRFLALVGNYERLKELTEEAANSEDAAQLQILKTMDSIETKLNQLKVTYQQFYADTGIEVLIKGIIDGITSVIDNLNGIPKAFDKIPAAALIMSGSLIMVVKSIALRIIGEISRAMEEAKKEAEYKSGKAGKSAGQKFVQNFKNELSQIKGNGGKEGVKSLFYFLGDTDSSISQALRGITSALTTVSFLIDQNTQKGKALAGTFQMASGALQGVQAISMAMQGSAGWVGLALTAITTIITGLSTAIETTEEKIERLTNEAEEASNKALTSKNNYKGLKSNIEKLEELSEARYNSVEAMQEYLDYNNQIAESNPELISSYDAEGNAIIDLTNSYLELANARRESADANLESANANLLLSQGKVGGLESQIQENQKSIKIDEKTAALDTQDVASAFISKGIMKDIDSLGDLSFVLGQLGGASNGIEATSEEVNKAASLLKSIYDSENSQETGRQAVEDYLSNFSFGEDFIPYTDIFKKYATSGENVSFLEWMGDSELQKVDLDALSQYEQSKKTLKNASATKVPEAIQSYFESYQNYLNTLDETAAENFKTQEADNYALAKEISQNAKEYALAQNMISQNQRAYISSFVYSEYISALDNTGKNILSFYEYSTETVNLLNDAIYEAFKTDLKESPNLDFDTWILSGKANNIIKEYSSIFETLTKEEAQAVNEIESKKDNYSLENYKAALNEIGLSEEQLNTYYKNREKELKETASLARRLSSINTSRKRDNLAILNTTFSIIQDSLSIVSQEALFSLEKQLYNLIDSGEISLNLGQNFIDNIYKAYEKAITFEPERELEITNILNNADLFSLTGIYEAVESLEEAGAGTEIINSIKDLTNYINVNVYTEWQSFGVKVKDKLEGLTEALANATEGMDFEEALAMANKLELSLGSDFRFENGEYFLDDIEAIKERYGNFGEELKGQLNKETDERIKELESERKSISSITGKSGLGRTGSEIQQEIDNIKLAQENALVGVDEYIAYHTNIAYLTAGLYEAFLTAVAGEDSKLNEKELLAAARQGEQALRDYVVKSGENFEEGYYSALIDSVSSTNDDILSAILDAKVSKGGTAYIGELTENTDLERYTEITAENVGQIFSEMYKGNAEAYNDAMTQYMESSYVDLSGMIAGLADDIENIDYSSITEIATAMGVSVNNIIYLFKNNFDGTFSTSLRGIQALAQRAGVGITSEIQDAINEYFNNILGIVSNGISGSMTNIEFDTLENFMGLDLDFTKTSEGLKLTKASAIEVYTELKKIDSIQAQITFSDLAESLEKAGSGYEDVASTMKTIAELNRELANVPVSSERRAELERELAVAEEILRVRSQDPDSFNFMDKDLPTGMQGPENYWNSVGEAYKVMNESAKSGYMEIQDYYNIINHMSSMIEASGGNLEWMGMNAKNASERAAELIRMGMGALSNVDGEGVKINLEELGADFDLGAEGMADGFASGIQEVAKSQIEMLDAAIQMLETIVAMEEIGNIDTEGDGIDLGNIFNNENPMAGYTEGYLTWRKSFLEAANKNEELKTALNSVFIEGRSLWELVNSNSLQLGKLSEKSLQNYADTLEALRQLAESDDYDLDNLLSSIDQLVENSGLAATINYTNENGTQIIVRPGEPSVAIEWESDKIKALLEGKSEEEVAQIKQLVNDWANGKSLEPIDMVTVYELIGKISINSNGKYTFMGQEFDPNDKTKLGQAIIDSEKIKKSLPEGQNFELHRDDKGNITYTTTYGVNNEVELTVDGNGEVKYTFGEYSGNSIDEVIEQYWEANKSEVLAHGGTKEQFIATFKGTVGIEAQPKLLTSEVTGKEGLTQEIIDEYGIDTSQVNTIAAAFETVDWSPIGAKIAEGISQALTQVGEGTDTETGIPIGELTLKPKGLKVDTTDIEPTLSSGEEALSNIPITSLTLTPETLYIDIANKTPQLKEGQTVTIENIPSATGTVTGSITITNNGDWSAAEGQTSPEVTGYNSANGTVETVTINGSSFKVTPVAGAPTNLDGELNPVESGFVKVEGNYYSVDLSSGTQLNPGMDLSGVTAGSAQVNATSYTVTFTNADGTTSQSVIVQGEAQLNAVLQNATLGDNGGWTLSGISAEADISISTKSENALINFFETLVNKLKNIEITYQNPTPVGPGPDTSTPGYYVSGLDNNSGNIAPIGQYSKLDASAVEDISAQVDNGTFQNGTFTITEMRADGTQITTTATLAELQAGTVNFSGAVSTPTPSGPQGGNSSGGSATPTALPSIDTSAIMANIQTAADSIVTRLGNAGQTGGAKAASAIQKTLDGIKSKTVTVNVKYPSTVSIGVNYSISVTTTSTGPGTVKGRISSVSAPGLNSYGANSASGSLAKGNINGKALASGSRKTLMGELGPELVVSNGRYFVVGQNGAEFVDLADDAIVFNHLQTKKLLSSGSSGYGKPVTNEKNAVSFATGNVDGPAMASASAALAQLRQIRAMWQSMLDASAKDLGSLAGAGGGGGGGGGGGDEVAAILGDLDRWYNLLRQIDSLEQHITLEQAKRANMKSGYDIVKSREKELAMLEKQKAAYEELNAKQKEYYDARRKDLLDSDYSQIFTYDEHGLMQYNEEEGKGLDILSALNATDSKGKAAMNAKEQLAYLKSIGFDTSILKTNEDGTKAKSEEDQMKNFWDGIDSWMEEMDGLYDSYHEAAINSEKATEQMNEILQEYIEERLEVEEKLKQAIEAREQAEIDRLEKEKESIEEATEAYINGLNQALDKEKSMYDKEQSNKDLTQLQNRLAILQRSGGSASEIKSLQDQINSRLKDAYFQEQQDQIDAIQEASDKQIEKLQEQIDIMQETLDYDKANGLLWEEVYSMLSQWTPDELLNFIQSYDPSYKEDSKTQNEEKDKETLTQLEGVRGKDYINEYGVFKENTLSKEYGEEILSRYDKEAEELYINSRKEGLTQAESENKVHEKISESVKAQDNVDTFITELEAQLGDLGLKNEWSKIYLDTYAATEGTESEKIKSAKNAVINSIKSSKWAEAPTSSQVKTAKKGYLYKDEGGKRSISKGKKITLTGADTLEDGTSVFTAKYTASHGSSYTGYITTDMVENGSDLHKQMSLYKKIENLKGYSSGGLVDYTGLAMVHGSKSKPESFINAEDTKTLRETIFSKNNNSLKELQNLLTNYRESMKNINNENNSNINIENVNISVHTDAISNGYDARRAGQEIFDEMVRISRKTGNVKLSRR